MATKAGWPSVIADSISWYPASTRSATGTARCRSFHAVDAYPPDVVFAFGSERFGFPEGFLERCDDVLAIPLYGVNNSLPVAIACGIALAEWARRRYAPGTILLNVRRPRPGATASP